MNCLSPSILSADLTRLGEEVRCVDEAGAQYLHIDIMDGHFVPNITFGVPIIEAVRKSTDKILDVHLMVEDPDWIIEPVAAAGADIISVHAEGTKQLAATVTKIKECGPLASVALSPATSLSEVEYVLPELSMVLVMTVSPGFGGQGLIPYTIDKIRDLKTMVTERALQVDIEVDGGITLDNVTEVMEAGANIIVAGSAIFKGDAAENTQLFLEKMR